LNYEAKGRKGDVNATLCEYAHMPELSAAQG